MPMQHRWSARIIAAVALLVISGLLAAGFEWLGLPAGLLLGPMIAGILLATNGQSVPIPTLVFRAAQSVVGLLIASSVTAPLLLAVAHGPAVFAGTTLVTLAASALIGALLTWWQVLPGTVAVWGSMPGAATAMVLMARDQGADSNLVAVMTYSRVACVASVASVLSALLGGHASGHSVTSGSGPLQAGAVAATLAVGAIGALAGTRLKLPAGALVGALLLGAVVNVLGVVRLELPRSLLAVSYAIVGWRIGLNFSREIVRAAARALPRVLAAIFVLIGFCAAVAYLLAKLTGRDLVTAYLATSPGGMDSVAIIASQTPVDVPFVMAMQALRFFAVLLVGPALARFTARRLSPAAG